MNVVNNRELHRLEISTPDGIAFLVYLDHPERLVIVHTEVPESLERRGLGGALVRAAVDLAVELGVPLDVRCPFARSWLAAHPDETARLAG
jgi:predicted GNAT family acetyltransferase